MRVLLAGGTGTVGAPVVRALQAAGHEVVLLTRRPLDAPPAGTRAVAIPFHEADGAVEAILHLAPDAVVSHVTSLPPAIDPKKLASVYAQNDGARVGAADIVARVARAAPHVRIVVQSVAFWYEPGPSPAGEATPLWLNCPEPIGTSVARLATMEERVRAVGGVVLRCGAFYGPGTYYARDGSITQLIAARKFPILGGGRGVTSFIHLDDVASATLAALTLPPEIYNVVDDEPVAAADWVPQLARTLGAPEPQRFPAFLGRFAIGTALTAWVTRCRGASNARLRATGWQPRFPSWRDGFAASWVQ